MLRKRVKGKKKKKIRNLSESYLLQVLHLVNHEGVVREEYIAPDDLEIREKFTEGFQTVHAIQ